MFELHVANNDVNGGTVSVGWCVSPETIKYMADRGKAWKNPVVVLITAPEGNNNEFKQYRKVVPLKDLVSYVEFRASGKCNVFGFIFPNEREAKDHFLGKKHDGQYHRDLLNSHADYWTPYSCNMTPGGLNIHDDDLKLLKAEPISVEVPTECFAPPPPKWEKVWVNWLNPRGDYVDQCDYRRARMFSYTVQPFIFAGNYFVKILMHLLALLYLSRGLTFKYLLHPLTYDLSDTTEVVQGGSFSAAQSGGPSFLNIARLLLTFPPLWPVYFIIWKAHAVFGVLASIVAVATVLALAFGVYMLITWLMERHQDAVNNALPWFLEPEEMNTIVCSTGKRITSINDLPSRKRTVRLRFQQIKSKVCRPFSK